MGTFVSIDDIDRHVAHEYREDWNIISWVVCGTIPPAAIYLVEKVTSCRFISKDASLITVVLAFIIFMALWVAVTLLLKLFVADPILKRYYTKYHIPSRSESKSGHNTRSGRKTAIAQEDNEMSEGNVTEESDDPDDEYDFDIHFTPYALDHDWDESEEEDALPNEINYGNAAFLVKGEEVRDPDSGFWQWLREKGYRPWHYGMRVYHGVDWVWINMNSRRYAHGMPGIGMAGEVGDHAITVDEFRVIEGIFDKYRDKPRFKMD